MSLLTPKPTTHHSPFVLAYGSDAMIPVELKVLSHRVIHYNPQTNEQLLVEPLDTIDEKRSATELRIAVRRHKSHDNNAKVRSQTFEVGDLVLKRIFLGYGKLGLT